MKLEQHQQFYFPRIGSSDWELTPEERQEELASIEKFVAENGVKTRYPTPELPNRPREAMPHRIESRLGGMEFS